MTVGVSATEAAAYLNTYRGSNKTAVTFYLKMHTGDPGSDGTANASAVTTRNAVTFAAPNGAGSMALSSVADYSMTTSETITHGSGWDASTAGNFLRSWAWTTGVPVINGSTLHVQSLTLAITPIAG